MNKYVDKGGLQRTRTRQTKGHQTFLAVYTLNTTLAQPCKEMGKQAEGR